MFKKFGLWLLAAFFAFAALVVAVSASTNSVFGSSDSLKESLAGSTVYVNVSDTIVDQAVKSFNKPPEARSPEEQGDLQLDPELTEKIARKVVTPDKLQTYAEQIVDGTYNWLEGEVDQPDYNIDVGTIKKDLANAVGDTAVERVEGLKPCTYQQLIQLQASGETDPFKIPCRPPGINLQAERAKLVKEVSASKELLEDTKITAEDTKSEGEQQTPFEHLAYVPTLFQWSQKLPLILGLLGVAAAAGVYYWSEDRRKALKKLSIILLVIGVMLFIGILLASTLFGSIRFDGTTEDQMREALIGVFRTLNAEFNNTLRIFAIVYTILGAAGLIWLRFTKPQSAPAQKTNTKSNKK